MTTTALLNALRAEHERSIKHRYKATKLEDDDRVLFLNGYLAALLFATAQVLSDAQVVTPGYVREALETDGRWTVVGVGVENYEAMLAIPTSLRTAGMIVTVGGDVMYVLGPGITNVDWKEI